MGSPWRTYSSYRTLDQLLSVFSSPLLSFVQLKRSERSIAATVGEEHTAHLARYSPHAKTHLACPSSVIYQKIIRTINIIEEPVLFKSWKSSLVENNRRIFFLFSICLDMTGRNTYGRAKKVVSRGGSSRGFETPSTTIHLYSTCDQSQEEHECSGTQQSPRHSTCEQIHTPNDGILLINEQGLPVHCRGRTTCIDIQNMPPGTRVHIEVNENNVPSNILESVLLGSYLGVIARDPVLAPISFPNWRNKGMEPFKRKMLAEVEFAFPGHIRYCILQSLGVKWRNHKTNLKDEHWDSRPIEEIMESIPAGVDAAQWCQLVTHSPFFGSASSPSRSSTALVWGNAALKPLSCTTIAPIYTVASLCSLSFSVEALEKIAPRLTVFHNDHSNIT
ncbi:hypothetical protein IEQ34_014052 [Dendrobium chrysotoxum]|uniref:Uncharacterized protein n=1 Tax=Dendrobium chrysotoxum TaxID=161865 RepID=A0AAV7GIW8_DENCH|nr:hypothetical protein IEQ34_014052 [Dendrobium chrysotoxum]